MTSAVIYALCEPDTGRIRYVGKANDARQRLRGHIYAASLGAARPDNTHRACWIRALAARGFEPQLVVLEQVDEESWPEAEKRWIRVLRAAGCDLINATDGGDRGWAVSAETRAKIRAAQKGRKQAPHVLAAAHAASRGRIHTDDEKTRRNAAIRKSHQRPEWRAAASVRVRALGLIPPVHIGEANPRTRLSDAQVVEIRERAARGEVRVRLAEEFAVTAASITQIVAGQTRQTAGGPLTDCAPRRRLTVADLASIRGRVAEGETQTSVAASFDVSQARISQIVRVGRS